MLHHIGYAVGNILGAINDFSTLGEVAILGEKIYDGDQKVFLQMISVNGCFIELITGEGVESMVNRGGPYHTCYETNDIVFSIKKMKSCGWTQITPMRSAPLFNDKRVIFFQKPGMGMVELLERY